MSDEPFLPAGRQWRAYLVDAAAADPLCAGPGTACHLLAEAEARIFLLSLSYEVLAQHCPGARSNARRTARQREPVAPSALLAHQYRRGCARRRVCRADDGCRCRSAQIEPWWTDAAAFICMTTRPRRRPATAGIADFKADAGGAQTALLDKQARCAGSTIALRAVRTPPQPAEVLLLTFTDRARSAMPRRGARTCRPAGRNPHSTGCRSRIRRLTAGHSARRRTAYAEVAYRLLCGAGQDLPVPAATDSAWQHIDAGIDEPASAPRTIFICAAQICATALSAAPCRRKTPCGHDDIAYRWRWAAMPA
jgi:hypothetical protein